MDVVKDASKTILILCNHVNLLCLNKLNSYEFEIRRSKKEYV